MLKILVTTDYGANHWVLEFAGNYDDLLTFWGGPKWAEILHAQRRDMTAAERDGMWGEYHRLYQQHEKVNSEWSYRVQEPFLGSRSDLSYKAWLSHLRYSLNHFDAEIYLDGPGDSNLKIGEDIYPAYNPE